MSTHSKFVRNRIDKLIGKAPTLKENTPRPPTTHGKREHPVRSQKESGLFRNYTYIKLQNKVGKISQNFNFICYGDEGIYKSYTFPLGQQMLYDNDEQSNFNQIREDIHRGYMALVKEVADCSSSHCDDTIQSSELS